MLEEIVNFIDKAIARPAFIYGAISAMKCIYCVIDAMEQYPDLNLRKHLEIGTDEFNIQFRTKSFQTIAFGFIGFYYINNIISLLRNL